MGETSEISWTDATHNEWIGCTRVSPGCQHCYAETLMDTRYGRVKWGKGQPRVLTSETNRRKPYAWDRAAAKAGVRTRVFSASLSDWLDHEVDPSWLAGLLVTVANTKNLDWLLLSKRPQLWRERVEAALRAIEGGRAAARDENAAINGASMCAAWLKGTAPANAWVGTTVEDQERADERVPQLLAIPARVRFLSCEPLLGPVKLRTGTIHRLDRDAEPFIGDVVANEHDFGTTARRIDWIIAGGESGVGARPTHPEWARALRDQAIDAGIAFFWKQWGEWAPAADQAELVSRLDLTTSKDINRIPALWISADGVTTDRSLNPRTREDDVVYRFGRVASGRLLDGREWNELPRGR